MAKRFVILFGLLAFGLASSGGAETLHLLLEHSAPVSDAAPPCPGESRAGGESGCDPDEPEPSAPEDDCPVCLTIQTAERGFTAPDVPDFVDDAEYVGVVHPRGVAFAPLTFWSAGPARAPPVCA